ncbi:MAG: enoyl-CoA hydratase-related protein, partial [Candidatus Thermoplasmatota archaeon]|nr:enoyl-CoA hydratase-related protein [Candidatus Thermoplasmatota archaeon]
TISSDLAVFGQAGPRHGSAPDGGSTDFLHLFVGIERAMQSGILCEMWTAYEAKNIGLITDAIPVLKVDGEYVRNPLLVTDKWLDESG